MNPQSITSSVIIVRFEKIWDLRLRRRIIWHLPSIIIILLVGLFFTRTIRIFLPSNDSTIALTQHCISKGERVRLLKEDNKHTTGFFLLFYFLLLFFTKKMFLLIHNIYLTDYFKILRLHEEMHYSVCCGGLPLFLGWKFPQNKLIKLRNSLISALINTIQKCSSRKQNF